ncbi:hypothetical protein BC833DRAFT_658974 [Globomyces pollinis-pini]|nr:hypothetical protein BC833DRAFT_658974 [Globomyces pollinis-pini]
MNPSVRIVKAFSTKTIPKIWVKFNENQATQVTTKNCTDVTDFIKNIKKELHCLSSFEITLHVTDKSDAISPKVPIAEAFKNNSDINPFYVKILSKTIFIQDIDIDRHPIDSFGEYVVENDADIIQIFEGVGSALYSLTNPNKCITKFKQLVDGEKYNVYSRYNRSYEQRTMVEETSNSTFIKKIEKETPKTIFIQDLDEKYRRIDSFKEYVVENENDLKQIYEGEGSALCLLTDPKRCITKVKNLIDGEKYTVYVHHERALFASKNRRRQHIEHEPMEETFVGSQIEPEPMDVTMESFLIKHLGPSAIEMRTDILGLDGKPLVQVQEWNAVLKVDNVLYLCEVKHNMTLQQVNSAIERMVKIKAQAEFQQANKIVGVFCGNFISEDLRTYIHEMGFMCVYRYG